jgi:predicted amidophosphoribosyltransferase
MNIIQCSICKKPFASLGGRICPACLEKIDRDFITVRDYIYDHKQSNIDVIAEETEVSKQTILHLLKEGRLIIDSPDGGGGGVLFCEMCKKPINTGRLCKNCSDKVSSKMDRSVSGQSRPQGSDEPNIKGSAKIGK